MAWETRGGNHYYYRKRRVNGRVVSEYLGRGEWVEAAVTLTALDRWERERGRLDLQDTRREQSSLDRQIEAVCQEIRTIIYTVLVITDHHRHKGQWRKRRVSNLSQDGLLRLQRGQGSQEDEQAFLEIARTSPGFVQLFDVVKHVQEQTIEQICGSNKAFELAGLQIVENTRKELGYDSSTIVEKLLIEQVIMSHLRLWKVEGSFTQNLKGASTATILYWEKRLSANQKRYLRALETLARVRRLMRKTPEVLQVNIGAQQVNQVTG